MAFNVFGYEIKRRKHEEKDFPTVVTPINDDGALVVDQSVNAGGLYTYGVDMDGVVKNDNELIRRYREISIFPEVDFAIEDICNEAIVGDQDEKIVTLNLSELKISDSLKAKFEENFEEILGLLDFNKLGHDIFRQWYVDGRLYYHVMFGDVTTNGLVELRLVDPQKIKKIKNIIRERQQNGVEVIKKIEEYYVYNDRGITEASVQGIKMTLDSIVYVSSGRLDASSGLQIGYLQKAIKPTNQLKMMEDSLVIYRLARAPERRIFYIDVGTMPKIKAEQYVKDIMEKFRNKMTYDAKTGEISNGKNFMSVLDDFWMPRREGGKGTEITTLGGGATLGQIDDIIFFRDKLYRSLNVPVGRLNPDQGFNLGRTSEISRDEIRFSKFIDRLRLKFSNLFLDILRIQLISKHILTEEEWKAIKQKIKFDYGRDNYFTELKEAEILNNRYQSLAQIQPFIGEFISKKTVMKNVLRMSDEEIAEEKKQLELEAKEKSSTRSKSR